MNYEDRLWITDVPLEDECTDAFRGDSEDHVE